MLSYYYYYYYYYYRTTTQNARMYKSLRFTERTLLLLALMCSSIVFLSCQSLDCFATIYYGTNFAVNILMGAALYSVGMNHVKIRILNTLTYINTFEPMPSFIHTSIQAYIPTYIHTSIYTYRHTETETHLHEVLQTCSKSSSFVFYVQYM